MTGHGDLSYSTRSTVRAKQPTINFTQIVNRLNAGDRPAIIISKYTSVLCVQDIQSTI